MKTLLSRKINNTHKKTLILYCVFMAYTIIVENLYSLLEHSKISVWLAVLAIFIGCSFLVLYGAIQHLIPKKGLIYFKAGTIASAGIALAIGANNLYCLLHTLWIINVESIIRILLFLIVFSTISCYVIFEKELVSEFIHKNRWFIALSVFLLFVLLKLSFTNAGCFHYSVQPSSQTSFTLPIFGELRDIRSDEWLVDMPRRASAEYSGYGLINDIVRGCGNYNISSSYLYLSYSALSNPFNLGFFLFGTVYGTAFYWSGLFIMSVIMAYEFSLVITGGNRRLSVLGMGILGLSQFALWWSINIHILCLQAIIVCSYHFLKKEKLWQKALLALGVALSGACFICNLYPAWQVPMAYVLIAIFAWLIIDNFDKIKVMRWKEWTLVGVAFVFLASIVLAYLNDTKAYSEAVMQTVYPGKRFDVGGDTFYKGSWYIQSLLYPFKNTGNNSEAGVFFNLFPLPMLLATITVIKQIITKIVKKQGKIDVLTLLLLVPTAFITLYCTKGFPSWLAKISLMGYSIPIRAIDVLGLANAYLLIRLLSYKDEDKISIPAWGGACAGILLVLYNIRTTQTHYPSFMTYTYLATISIIIVALVVVLLCKTPERIRNAVIAVTTVLIIMCGVLVLPVSRGLDSLFEKPASHTVQQIVEEDPDAKWIGYDTIIFPQFLIANGAPTINSINYIPNMELWQKLDPTGQYNEVYNRYSHVCCIFTSEPTSFTLAQPDLMVLRLNYEDIKLTEVKYVFSPYPIQESSNSLDFSLIYNEENVFIYEIIYY